MTDIKDAMRRFKGRVVEPRRAVLSGWMVNHEGRADGSARVTAEPGNVYVLIDRGEGAESGDVIKAASRVRPVPGWPVFVGTTRERPWDYVVLDVDREAMGGALDGQPILESHWETHLWGHPQGGDDAARIRFLQLYDIGQWPAANLSIDVASGMYDAAPSGTYDVDQLAYSNVDLSGTKPTWGQRWTLVCLSPSGTFELVPGTIKSFVTEDDIPDPPSEDHWRLCAVKLRSTDTQIINTPLNRNIIDLRFVSLGWPKSRGGARTFLDLADTPSSYAGQASKVATVNAIENALEWAETIGWDNVIVVAKTMGPGVDYTSIQDAIDNAASGDCILIMPGTYAEKLDLTANKDLYIRGLSYVGTYIFVLDTSDDVIHYIENTNTTTLENLQLRGIFDNTPEGAVLGIGANSEVVLNNVYFRGQGSGAGVSNAIWLSSSSASLDIERVHVEWTSDGGTVNALKIDANNDVNIRGFTSNAEVDYAINMAAGTVVAIDVPGEVSVTGGTLTLNAYAATVGSSPEKTWWNRTSEDTDGGRESRLRFWGQQSGGERSTLAWIEAAHDGAADDEKGRLTFCVNDGGDGDTPTEAVRIDSAGDVLTPRRSMVRAYRSTAQTIPTGSVTIVQYNTENWDTQGEWDNATNFRFQPNEDGYFRISAALLFNTTAALSGNENVYLALYRNGGHWATLDRKDNFDGTAEYVNLHGTTTLNLTTSDYIDIRVFQNSGGDLDIFAAAIFNYVDINRIG